MSVQNFRSLSEQEKEEQERDEVRTEQFEAYGYRVIRFDNEEVLNDTEGVLAAIAEACRGCEGG